MAHRLNREELRRWTQNHIVLNHPGITIGLTDIYPTQP